MKGRQVDVVPAAPGWAVVVPVWEGHRSVEVFEFGFEPVIAWQFVTSFSPAGDPGTYCVPLTVEGSGLWHWDGTKVLRRPDGSYVSPGVGGFRGLDDVRRVLVEERLARFQSEAERAAAREGVSGEA